jgi:hypothetical protein
VHLESLQMVEEEGLEITLRVEHHRQVVLVVVVP